MLDVHERLDRHRAVRLQHPLRHPGRELRHRVADIDLAAGDVVLPAVERGRLGEPGDRVLGGGVGRRVRARRVRRDRPVVDDAPATRLLALHDPERFLRAQEDPGHVHVHHLLPLLVGEVFQRHGGRPHPGVVEEHVEAPERLLRLREEGAHRGRIGDVGRHHERALPRA